VPFSLPSTSLPWICPYKFALIQTSFSQACPSKFALLRFAAFKFAASKSVHLSSDSVSLPSKFTFNSLLHLSLPDCPFGCHTLVHWHWSEAPLILTSGSTLLYLYFSVAPVRFALESTLHALSSQVCLVGCPSRIHTLLVHPFVCSKCFHLETVVVG